MTYFGGASKTALCSVLAALALAGGALAADKPQRAPSVQAVIDCRKLEDTAQRLACYDGAVARMEDAEAKGDLVTVDREQRKAARRQAFGFNLPSLALFDRGESAAEVDRMVVKVADARLGDNGRWTIRLEDGAVWQQTDDAQLAWRPKAGSDAVIRRGLVGGYSIAFPGLRTILARRVN